jgi:hypothetical protein
MSCVCCMQFVETNKELLSELPPPMAAAAYYRNADLYMVSCSMGQLATIMGFPICTWLSTHATPCQLYSWPQLLRRALLMYLALCRCCFASHTVRAVALAEEELFWGCLPAALSCIYCTTLPLLYHSPPADCPVLYHLSCSLMPCRPAVAQQLHHAGPPAIPCWMCLRTLGRGLGLGQK